VPCQTIHRLETATPRSSRTKGIFPSDNLHNQKIGTKLTRIVLNPTNVRL